MSLLNAERFPPGTRVRLLFEVRRLPETRPSPSTRRIPARPLPAQSRPVGVVIDTPTHPNSWFMVALDSGETTKCRLGSLEFEVRGWG